MELKFVWSKNSYTDRVWLPFLLVFSMFIKYAVTQFIPSKIAAFLKNTAIKSVNPRFYF